MMGVRVADEPVSRAGERTLARSELLAYGALRAPLALMELPLFVLLPAFYSREAGLSLALVGGLLFAARSLDALADPVIGAWIDRSRGRWSYRAWIYLALPALVAGFCALLAPPLDLPRAMMATWLVLASALTYLAWSTVTIAHQAWGAELGSARQTRVRVTGYREACGLAGVLLSALLLDPDQSLALIAAFIVATTLSAALLARAPLPHAPESPDRARPSTLRQLLLQPWSLVRSDARFARLLAIFMINGIASALPATLVLFFVADVLGAKAQAPLFLLAYFAAAAVGMPAWVHLGARIGARPAWLVGMLASVAAFTWAFMLGQGDLLAFGLICVVTGLALGADLAMPPALLAAVIADSSARAEREGAAFGVWALVTKLNLAAAAGLGLPLLAVLGYEPSSPSGSTLALSLAYAVLPCCFKLIAAVTLWRSTDLEPSQSR